MKSLSTLLTLCLVYCHLSAQLFYKNPDDLHEKYVAGYKALFSDASSSDEKTYRGSAVPSTQSYNGDNLTSEKFQYLQNLGEKLIIKAEKHFREDHAEMAMYLHNVGCLYAAYHEFGEAERLFHAALSIWAKRIGPKEPQFILTDLHLAECYILEGRAQKSNSLLNNAYSSLNSFLIPDKLHLFERELEAVDYYWSQGDHLAAEYYLDLAIKHMPYGGETDGNRAYLFTSLGKLYQEMRRYPESVGFYKEAWKIWSKQNAAFHESYQFYDDNLLLVPTIINIDRYITANSGTIDYPIGEIEDSYFLNPSAREVPQQQMRGLEDNWRLNRRHNPYSNSAPYRDIHLKKQPQNMKRDHPRRLFSPRRN